MAVPTLRQHISSAANCPAVYGSTNNNYVLRIPNAVGAGNCLILGITYDAARTISSVSDNINGTWAAATITVTGGFKTSVLSFPNAGAGVTAVTVTFNANNSTFQFELSEFYNVKTSSPGGGSVGIDSDAGPALATGSFTPTNNDANGGNLIWAYFPTSDIAGGVPTSFVPGGSFILLSGDISGKSTDMFPKACAYFVQSTSASINPSMTATGDSGSVYNCVAIALQAASAGVAQTAGVWVKKVTMQSPKEAQVGAFTIQLPTTGNLNCIFFDTVIAAAVTNITDNQGNTWTKRQTGTNIPMWHTTNSTASAALIATLTIGTLVSARWTLFAFDIESATTSPFQVFQSPNEIDTSGVAFVDDAPTITPTGQPGISLAYVGTGIGPVTGFHAGSPSGALFLAPTYDGETDGDFLTNAAGLAMLYHTSTSAQHWNWVIFNDPSNTAFPGAIVFSGASGSSTPSSGMSWFPGLRVSGGPVMIPMPTGLGPPNKA